MPETRPHISVDFSNSTEEGLIFARHEQASSRLAEGDEVVASDEDHESVARVVRVVDEGVFLALDPSTWVAPTRPGKSTATIWLAKPEVVEIAGNESPAEATKRSANIIPVS